MYDERCNINALIGKTIDRIDQKAHSDKPYQLLFVCGDELFTMYHEQDCCEGVWLEDIAGDLDDLVGSPVLQAEEVTDTTSAPADGADESYTWTFYKLATIKGSVTLRWFGTSNGYYSERVDFVRGAVQS